MAERTAYVGTRPQLFVDGHLVSMSQGLTEHTHQMAKHPGPVLKAEAPWERPEVAGLAGAVNAIYDADDGLFKLWYYARRTHTAGSLPGVPGLSCYATSRDGINFERPNLGLTEFNGSTANNILNDGVGPGHGMLDCAEMADVEPADKRFKSVEWMGSDDNGQGMHGASFSPDGLRWRTHDGNPVIRGREHGDSITAAKLRDSYLQPGRPAGISQRQVRAVSKDPRAARPLAKTLHRHVHIRGRAQPQAVRGVEHAAAGPRARST